MAGKSNRRRDTLKVSAARLREACPILRLKNIRAGDVLLTFGNRDEPLTHLESVAIAAFSGGRYSHAAIWLPHPTFERDDGDGFGYGFDKELVESDDYGVGHTWLATTILRSARVRGEHVAILADRVTRAIVVRHQELEKATEDDIRKATKALRETDLHWNYSKLWRLTNASILPRQVKSLIQKSLDRPTHGTDPIDHRRSFCSEFVLKFFQNLPNFEALKKIDPSSVAPGFFAHEGNGFKVVPDAVLTAEDIDDTAEGLLPFSQSKEFRRAESLPKLVKLASRGRESETQWKRAIQDIGERLDHQRAMLDVVVTRQVQHAAGAVSALRATLDDTRKLILTLIAHERSADAWRDKEIGDDLLQTVTFLICIVNFLEDVRREEQLWLDPDKRDAMDELLSMVVAWVLPLARRILNFSYRQALRLVRLSAEPARVKVSERASLIDGWVAGRKAFATLERQRPVALASLSQASQIYVKAVVARAREDAAAILASGR